MLKTIYALAELIDQTRGHGNTTGLVEAARLSDGILVVASERQASILRINYPKLRVYSFMDLRSGRTRGLDHGGPVFLDNHAVADLIERLRSENEDLRKELAEARND